MNGNNIELLRHTSPRLARCLIALATFTCLLSAAQGQTPIWSEEFNYTGAPDSDVWSYDLGNWGWGNQELQNYTSSTNNAWVDGNNLVITAIKTGSGGGATFTSARIRTQDKLTFKYGTVEARISTPDLANGLWPAFWTLGNNFPPWPDCGEIDIMEMGIGGAIGDGKVNQRVGSHFHWDENGGYANWGNSYDMPSPINDTFVVYRMEWTPTAISTYINDIHIVTMNTAHIPEFNAEHFFILNCAVGGTYTGIFNASGITASFPAEYRVDWIRIYDNGYTVLGPTPPEPSTPYYGTPLAVPGTVEAEDYDNGGPGVAYSDSDSSNNGGQYRTSEWVDIEACSDTGRGYNVGWTEAGEWLKYTVDVAPAGDYTITTRVASDTGGGVFHIEVDGVDVTGPISVQNTGGWQTWVDKTASVSLGSGEQVVKLVIENAGMNINHMEFVLDQEEVNTPPVFTSDPISQPNATEDSAYSATIAGSATDANAGDTLTYSKVSGPAWLNVAAGGALSGTPGNDDVGLNSWTVEVSDGIHSPVSATLEITVDNVNDDPVFTTDPVIMPNGVINSGYNGTLAGSATDVDAGDTLSYFKWSGPVWLNVSTDGTLSGTPDNTGLNSWTVVVRDGSGRTDTATLQIMVDNAVTTPSLSIQVSGSNLEVLWSAAATGFNLYGTTNLTPSAAWSAVTNSPSIQGDDWMVTIPLDEAPPFFRLQNP